MTASDKFTISVGVPTFLVRGDVYFWGSMMAAAHPGECNRDSSTTCSVEQIHLGITAGEVKG